MILYHGTADLKQIINGSMEPGTWLALHKFHAYRIAERRANQRGGDPVVIEILTDSFSRVEGRDNPTYLFSGGEYKVIAILRMTRRAI